jgi:hypothetical protein
LSLSTKLSGSEARRKKVPRKIKFHLLLEAQASSSTLCRTILSALVLNYPPPTLLNWNNSQESLDLLLALQDFLASDFVANDDIILLINQHTRFQLPPEVLLSRFKQVNDAATEGLQKVFSSLGLSKVWSTFFNPDSSIQTTLFGTSSVCVLPLSQEEDCDLISDKGSNWYTKKAASSIGGLEYLDPNLLLGTAKDIQKLLKAATRMSHSDSPISNIADLARIYLMQQRSRLSHVSLASSIPNDLKSWLSTIAGWNKTQDTSQPVSRLSPVSENGLGIDNHNAIFQHVTSANQDISFVRYDKPAHNDSKQLDLHPELTHFHVPKDVAGIVSPFSTYRTNKSAPAVSELDTLPQLTWLNLSLATNTRNPSVPAMLNMDRDDDQTWHQMWFHPYARALLRRHDRSALGIHAAEAASNGGENWWDDRGGKGGVWTDKKNWMAWKEVCRGYEDSVFGDGKGVWGMEDGRGKVINFWGTVMEDPE